MFYEFKSKYTEPYYLYLKTNKLTNKKKFTISIENLKEILKTPESYTPSKIVALLEKIVKELTRILDSDYKTLVFNVKKNKKRNNKIEKIVFKVITKTKNYLDYIFKSNEIEGLCFSANEKKEMQEIYKSTNLKKKVEEYKQRLMKEVLELKNGH